MNRHDNVMLGSGSRWRELPCHCLVLPPALLLQLCIPGSARSRLLSASVVQPLVLTSPATGPCGGVVVQVQVGDD